MDTQLDNHRILQLLQKERDRLFEKTQSTTISELYKEQHQDVKAGRVFVFDGGDKELMAELKELSQDTSLDELYKSRARECLNFDNASLIQHFENEVLRVFNDINNSGKLDSLHALFFEYDYYYRHPSLMIGYGQHNFPVVEEPRYILDGLGYPEPVLISDNGINFEPAWINCEEFDDLDHLEVSYDLENLFILHSVTLLHQAIDNLEVGGKLLHIKNRPFTFYLNEHDCEVRTVYRLMRG